MSKQRVITDASSGVNWTVVALSVVAFAGFFSAFLYPHSAQAQSTAEAAIQSRSQNADGQAAVGAKCVSCHRPYVAFFLRETHGKSARYLNDSRAAACETCHGNGQKHIENRENRIAAEDIENPTELKTLEEEEGQMLRAFDVTLVIVVILTGKAASTTEAT